MKRTPLLALVCSGLVGASIGVEAQADNGLEFDGYVGIVSDFRDRGLSLSGKDPALMASLGVFHDRGFYAGGVGAIIDDGRGGDAKAEFYAGYQWGDDSYTYDLSVELDTIHGNGSHYFPEIKGAIARDFGLAYVRAGASYAPDGRWFTPDNDSFYAFSDLEIPVPTLPEVTAILRAGRDFRSGLADVWDWGAGVSVFVNNVEISLMYEDSGLDQREGKGTVTLGARFYF